MSHNENYELTHFIIANAISDILLQYGGSVLVGSNAWRIAQGLTMYGDLDFVVYNKEFVYNMPHKVHQGIYNKILTTTICIHGISIDISTIDGININQDLQNRSCVTSAIILTSSGYHIISHTKERYLIPANVDSENWIRNIIRIKGKRVLQFWQKKLSSGYVWKNSII